MRTISQVAKLTGVSTRTLQYYDEIGLLKPSELTPSGYRLYDDDALQTLQQILLFRELEFKLKDIKEILADPDFDRITVFRKQKELLLLKRNRTDGLIRLLDRLEKGDECMSFKEFDLSDYIAALKDFKKKNTAAVIEHWGSVENYDMFIQRIQDHEETVAKSAIKQFGSVEKYTEAMKYNLEHFQELMDKWRSQIPEEMQQNDWFQKLASHKECEVSSPEVWQIVREIIAYAQGNAPSELFGNQAGYCSMIIDLYSNHYLKSVMDTKYGTGACDYIVKAFQYYSEHEGT